MLELWFLFCPGEQRLWVGRLFALAAERVDDAEGERFDALTQIEQWRKRAHRDLAFAHHAGCAGVAQESGKLFLTDARVRHRDPLEQRVRAEHVQVARVRMRTVDEARAVFGQLIETSGRARQGVLV